MNHIGIDMSKDTFHTAFDDKKVKVFANTKPGIAAFLKTIDDLGFAIEDTKIGVESTGIYPSSSVIVLREQPMPFFSSIPSSPTGSSSPVPCSR